jgi:hypothetical protein
LLEKTFWGRRTLRHVLKDKKDKCTCSESAFSEENVTGRDMEAQMSTQQTGDNKELSLTRTEL